MSQPLEGERPASGAAMGIGDYPLPITGQGILRHGDLRIAALRVAGLKTSLISESELLNSDPALAIITTPGPPGTHIKKVTKHNQTILYAPESAGLFRVTAAPPPSTVAVATPLCGQSPPGERRVVNHQAVYAARAANAATCARTSRGGTGVSSFLPGTSRILPHALQATSHVQRGHGATI